MAPNWLLSIIYKVISLLSGVVIVYMGYKLFMKGIYSDTGEVAMDWNNNKLRNEIATLSSNEQPKGTDSNQS